MDRHQLRLVALFGAITICFVLYSLFQERLMTRGFGPQGERFSYSIFVIFVNRLVTMAVSAAALALTEHSVRPSAPVALFAIPSLANVVASAAQYEALKYVSFPLQALAKCAKTVPVMIWGLFIGGSRYGKRDYLCSAAVTLGCAVFVLTGNIAAPSIHHAVVAATAAARVDAAAVGGGGGGGSLVHNHWAMWGGTLLAAFLLFDGLASTSQDRLFSKYPMHSCNQLLWVTAWSAGFSLTALVTGGQLAPAVAFVGQHPACLGLILGLSALSTSAQLFIFYTIQKYGALRFALVMTVRQFLSIVLSCLVFSHHLSLAQWAGTALVIGALAHRAQGRAGLRRKDPQPAVDGPLSLVETPLIPVIQVGQTGKQSPLSPASMAKRAQQGLLAHAPSAGALISLHVDAADGRDPLAASGGAVVVGGGGSEAGGGAPVVRPAASPPLRSREGAAGAEQRAAAAGARQSS